jgi:hypothetical protein
MSRQRADSSGDSSGSDDDGSRETRQLRKDAEDLQRCLGVIVDAAANIFAVEAAALALADACLQVSDALCLRAMCFTLSA